MSAFDHQTKTLVDSKEFVTAMSIEAFPEDRAVFLLGDNIALIALANRLRRSLDSSPTQSSFRVIAIFVVEHGAEGNRVISLICGSNSEPGNIGGSICAERAALCRLRFLIQPRILKVGVNTDSLQPISPGPLCREYLASHASLDTPIVIGNSTGDRVFEYPLGDLIPQPYLYRQRRREQVVAFAKDVASRCQPCTPPANSETDTDGANTKLKLDRSGNYHGILPAELRCKLTNEALAVNHWDHDDALHPIRLSAAVIYSDDSVYSTWHMKGLEYGCTSDPVEALVHHMVQQQQLVPTKRPVALVMIDQFGVCHAPFARARAQLLERHFDDVLVLVHQEDGSLIDVTAQELLPSPKNIPLLSESDFSNHEDFLALNLSTDV